jgi:hypothetical protein
VFTAHHEFHFRLWSVTGKETEEVTLADVVHRLTAIEEIVRPLQLVNDQLTAIEATVAEQEQ